MAIYNKLREIEPVIIKQTKPSSIVLGTSRPKNGIDVSHKYFKPVSYNLAIPAGSIYENKQLFKLSIQQGNLKQVLLGLDYRMFSLKDKENDGIISNSSKIKYIFSSDALIDSFKTILEIGDAAVLRNGNTILFNKYKNYANEFKSVEKEYYKNNSKDYTYTNTGKNSFLDFEEILEIAKQNVKRA